MNSLTIAQTVFWHLASILAVVLAVGAIFFIKLMIDLNRLANNLDETATLVKHEIEPTLVELRQTLGNLNSIAKNTDRQMENIKGAFAKVIDISGAIFGQFRSLSGGFFKGLYTGIQLFNKRNK